MPVEPRPLPMPEAEAYWQDKVPMAPGEFRTLGQRARSRAFAVSGMDRMDLVSRVHAAVARAIAEGRTLEEFRREAGPLLEQEGITSRARLETIFRTNVQGAYLAGRYAQMLEAVKFRPYWRYSAVNDSRTRPSHRALHGLVRRYDDPFWDVFYPPNGFNCRCTVSSLSERQVRAAGIEVGQGIPDLIEPLDRETGLPGLPVRPWPDPGFANNAAKDWLAGLAPHPGEGELRELVALALCREGRGLFMDSRCKPALADLDPRHLLPFDPANLLPRDLSPAGQVLAFLREFGLTSLDQGTVLQLPGNRPLAIGQGLFTDRATGEFKGSWTGQGPYLRLLARAIKNPFEIWWTPVDVLRPDKPAQTSFALRLLRLFRKPEAQEIAGYATFTHLGRAWYGSTSFASGSDQARQAMLDSLENQRGGVLVYREMLK